MNIITNNITYKDFKELIKTYKIIKSTRVETTVNNFRNINISIPYNKVNRGYIISSTRCHVHIHLLENLEFYVIYYFRYIKNQPMWIRTTSLNKWMNNTLKKEKLNLLLKNE